jgi:hypothetical protein
MAVWPSTWNGITETFHDVYDDNGDTLSVHRFGISLKCIMAIVKEKGGRDFVLFCSILMAFDRGRTGEVGRQDKWYSIKMPTEKTAVHLRP